MVDRREASEQQRWVVDEADGGLAQRAAGGTAARADGARPSTLDHRQHGAEPRPRSGDTANDARFAGASRLVHLT